MGEAEPLLHGRRVRGLTLWRPWPWAFVHAGKRVENRTWPAPRQMWGGWVALHAGGRFDREAALKMQAGQFGAAATACSLIAAEHREAVVFAVARLERCVDLTAVMRRNHSPDPWAFGPYVWEFGTFVPLHDPLPRCTGKRGLWKLPRTVVDELARRVDDYLRP